MLPHSPAKVGYVVKRYPRYSETFIVNEILAHEAAGLQVEIFALRPPADTHFQAAIAQVRAPVTYLSAPTKVADFWRALDEAGATIPGIARLFSSAGGNDARTVYQAVQLARLAQERGVTHLHAHFATSATTVAQVASHLSEIPYSFTAHAKDIFHESVDDEDLRRKLRDAAAVVTVSDYNLAYLQERYGANATRVHRVYNGLDLDRFRFQAPVDRPPIILAVGRLVEKKGFEYLIDACRMLADAGRSFTCRIIGSGDLEADLRRRIEHHGLHKYVEMLGPHPQPEVVEHVLNAAAFAAPCVVGQDGNRDGLPTVLLEAMALGTPCVSTDVTGIPEVLCPEDTGLMVPQHDPAALAIALSRLLDDEALRVRLALQARTMIEEEFDIHVNAARIRSLFEAYRWRGDALPEGQPLFGEVG